MWGVGGEAIWGSISVGGELVWGLGCDLRWICRFAMGVSDGLGDGCGSGDRRATIAGTAARLSWIDRLWGCDPLDCWSFELGSVKSLLGNEGNGFGVWGIDGAAVVGIDV